MSVKALSCAMALRGVSPSEKLLLLALANYADENMRCYPSQKRLAEDTCLTDRTIRTLLAGLEDRRMISRAQRERQDGSRTSDIITLHFAGVMVDGGVEILSGGTEAISGGAAPVSGGVGKQLPPPPETASGLTTFEPSINHQIEPSSLVVATSAPPTRRASKRAPDSWSPSDQTRQALISEGHDAGALERALTRMRDHEFKSARSDWDAAFRNWVRRDADHKPSNRNDQSHADKRQAAREDSLRDHYAGAMAALNRRVG